MCGRTDAMGARECASEALLIACDPKKRLGEALRTVLPLPQTDGRWTDLLNRLDGFK